MARKRQISIILVASTAAVTYAVLSAQGDVLGSGVAFVAGNPLVGTFAINM